MFGASEGRFGVDHPILPGNTAQESGERFLLSERLALTEKQESLAKKRLFQPGDELSAKNSAKE
jgi:hypothetical protein